MGAALRSRRDCETCVAKFKSSATSNLEKSEKDICALTDGSKRCAENGPGGSVLRRRRRGGNPLGNLGARPFQI